MGVSLLLFLFDVLFLKAIRFCSVPTGLGLEERKVEGDSQLLFTLAASTGFSISVIFCIFSAWLPADAGSFFSHSHTAFRQLP